LSDGFLQALALLLAALAHLLLPRRVAPQDKTPSVLGEDLADLLVKEIHLQHLVFKQFFNLRFGQGGNEMKLGFASASF